MQQKINHLTKEGYENLVQELHVCKKIELPAVLERLTDAKALWDLSENFEYKSALEEKELLQIKINEIEELLLNVEIIQEEKKSVKKWDKVVDYWSKVVFMVEDDDKQYSAHIVGTGEVGVLGGELKISFDSPLGIAIKGKKIGDVAKMRIQTGRKEVKIINIE